MNAVFSSLLSALFSRASGRRPACKSRSLRFGTNSNSVDKVEIKWPDGSMETVQIPGVDRKLTVIEGKGVSK
jgi:hypothetical protein